MNQGTLSLPIDLDTREQIGELTQMVPCFVPVRIQDNVPLGSVDCLDEGPLNPVKVTDPAGWRCVVGIHR